MQTAAKVLFLLGAIPTVGAIAILVALASRPASVSDHLQGVARYLIGGGVAIMAARVFMGWTPSLEAIALVLGLGLGLGMHARQNNLVALAQEKLEKAARQAGG